MSSVERSLLKVVLGGSIEAGSNPLPGVPFISQLAFVGLASSDDIANAAQNVFREDVSLWQGLFTILHEWILRLKLASA